MRVSFQKKIVFIKDAKKNRPSAVPLIGDVKWGVKIFPLASVKKNRFFRKDVMILNPKDVLCVKTTDGNNKVRVAVRI